MHQNIDEMTKEKIIQKTIDETDYLLPKAEVREIADIFATHADGSGGIGVAELTSAFGAAQHATEINLADGLLEGGRQAGKDGMVGFEEFITFRACQAKAKKTGINIKRIMKARELFSRLDNKKDRDGKIQIFELIGHADQPFPEDDFLLADDADRNCRVDFNEFLDFLETDYNTCMDCSARPPPRRSKQ